MARFLAFEWDHEQLHIVAATVGRGGVYVQRAAVWQEEQNPGPANAEALGKLLRERLKAAGIAPAPALVCIGRDRLILKEVLHPAVADAEEPALVRFQAAKDLTDAPDEVVMDYTSAGEPAPSGERRALALIARRDLVDTYQTLCKAAGLKLLALTPRPFGTLTCLQLVVGTTGLTPPPEPPDATVAVLTVTERWAEFCVGRGEKLLLARALPIGNALAGEVRRNVTVFSGQSADKPVRALYVAGSADHASLCERLEQLLGIPVYMMDPFSGIDRPELPQAHRGGFSGVVGLVHSWARAKKLPIDFVHPKEPKTARDPNQRRLIFGAALAAAVLVAIVSFFYNQLAAKETLLDELAAARTSLDRRLVDLEEDAKRIKALDDWTQTEIVWLDELYDLTDRIPDPNAIRLTMLQCDPLTASGKDKHVARMALKGITTQNNEAIDALQRELVAETTYYRVDALLPSRNTGVERNRFFLQFATKVDIEKRPPDKYVRKIELPADEENGGGRNRRPGGIDLFNDGGQP